MFIKQYVVACYTRHVCTKNTNVDLFSCNLKKNCLKMFSSPMFRVPLKYSVIENSFAVKLKI